MTRTNTTKRGFTLVELLVVMGLMGALAFRTSFTQNVLRHSVEVALLMGTMAAEMGLDAARARRIGFLHDVGKAITAEKKGAHAVLGAEFLKSHGEADAVCAAVAAHHSDPGTDGGVYGVLCSAADAISSARPGARQESLGDYVQRLETIEKLRRPSGRRHPDPCRGNLPRHLKPAEVPGPHPRDGHSGTSVRGVCEVKKPNNKRGRK